MNRIFGAVVLAALSMGSTSIALADTNTNVQQIGAPQTQHCQVAQLQQQVNTLTNEVVALQAQQDTPSPSENVINNLATGG